MGVNTIVLYYSHVVCMVTCMYGHKYSKSKDQPGKVANSARGQLNREKIYFPALVRT